MPKKASASYHKKKKTLSKKTMKKKSPKKSKKSQKKSKRSKKAKTALLSYHPGQYYLPNKFTEHGFPGCRDFGGIPRHSYVNSSGTNVGDTCAAPKGQRTLSDVTNCYGQLKRNCSADDGCHWTKRYDNRFGTTVKGHCGLIPNRSTGTALLGVSRDASPRYSAPTPLTSRPVVPMFTRPLNGPLPKFEPMTLEEQLIEDLEEFGEGSTEVARIRKQIAERDARISEKINQFPPDYAEANSGGVKLSDLPPSYKEATGLQFGFGGRRYRM
jgi:hypothetical protein